MTHSSSSATTRASKLSTVAFPRPSRLVPVVMLGLASFGMTTFLPSPASAAPDASAEASDHFQRGVDFSKDGDFEAALVEFKRAYELSPNYRVLFNLGQTSRELRDYAGALKSFSEYLRQGGADAPKRDKVEQWVTELKGKVATVTFKVNVPGADVSVDDVSIGVSPLKDAVLVNAGKRKVSATLSGYSPLQKYIDLAGTDSKTVVLELSPVGATPSGGQIKNGPVDNGPIIPERKASPAPWIALGSTGAVGIATAVLGGLALSSKSQFDKALNTFPGNGTDIENKRSKTKSLAAAADVLGGVTGAGIVVTIVLFATQPLKSTPASDSAQKSAAWKPEFGVGLGSLDVHGRF